MAPLRSDMQAQTACPGTGLLRVLPKRGIYRYEYAGEYERPVLGAPERGERDSRAGTVPRQYAAPCPEALFDGF